MDRCLGEVEADRADLLQFARVRRMAGWSMLCWFSSPCLQRWPLEAARTRIVELDYDAERERK